MAWSTAGVAGIVLVGRHADTLEKTAKSLKTKTLVAPADVTSESDIKEVFEKAMSEFGKVDVLINAAGTMNQGAMIGETEPAKWWIDFVGPAPLIKSQAGEPNGKMDDRNQMSKAPTIQSIISFGQMAAKEP